MGQLIPMDVRPRRRPKPSVQPKAEAPQEPMKMRWGWTLSMWVSVGLVFRAAYYEDLLWVCIHIAFVIWTKGVRRNNDMAMGGKHW